MGQAWMLVTNELLVEMLHLPKDTTILGVETPMADLLQHRTRFYIEHPDLPMGIPGNLIPNVTPTFVTTYDKDGKVTGFEFEKW